jgi:4-amino-4-deoxy-L-arabinose transferase-like glycosyltransferase
MRLNAPKVTTFWISVALVVLGFLATQGAISGLGEYSFWMVIAGFILLALGTLMKGL